MGAGQQAALVTGGRHAPQAVEVWLPGEGGTHCRLPPLPLAKEDHSITNTTLCGGNEYFSRNYCIRWADGEWEEVALENFAIIVNKIWFLSLTK